MPWLLMLRVGLALLFLVSGTLHLVLPGPYRSIMPSYLPAHALLVSVSGWAEVAGSLGLILAPTRRYAGWGLLLLLVAVFPANIEMLRLYRSRGVPWWGETLLWLRLPLQLVLMMAVWRVSQPAAARTSVTP
jgi:uncharacterized membrane protein